jgi:secreted trypsin-like serine protease
MVNLVVNKDGQPYTCGGTLISKKHFVTAANCFLDSKGNVSFSGFTSITLGAHDLSANSNDRNRQVVKWSSGTYYSADITERDIAIFTLSQPVNLTGNHQPFLSFVPSYFSGVFEKGPAIMIPAQIQIMSSQRACRLPTNRIT